MSQAGTILPPGGAAGGILKVDGDVGSAVPTVLGEIIVEGGTSAGGVATNINTIAGVNTVEICLNNNISQPTTNAAATEGVYLLGGSRFMHNYGSGGLADANTFLGEGAGNFSLINDYNTGLGQECLKALTTGESNTACGAACLQTLTDGADNTFVGMTAGQTLVHGDNNVAVGTRCMIGVAAANPSYNVAIGDNCLQSVKLATGCVAVGASSLGTCTSGNYNTCVGYNSLSGITTGTLNTVIGVNAGDQWNGTEHDNIAINYRGVAGENNTIHIGTLGTPTSCFIQGIASVSVSNKHQVTIDSTTGQLGSQAIEAITHWQVIGVSGALAVNNGYICTSGAALSFSLPATSPVGSMISLTLDGSTSWTITQGAGQSIRIGALATTPGVGGSLASAAQGDSVTMVCTVADTRWVVVSEIGTISVV